MNQPHVHGPDCAHDDHGHVHGPHCNHDHGPREPVRNAFKQIGRNDPCPCGSGNKFKKCHGG